MAKYNLPVDYHSLPINERRAVREQYVKEQRGLCFWCKCDLYAQPPQHILVEKINWKQFPPSFLKYPIHLQHSHGTGLTLGATHSLCRAVMVQHSEEY